MSVKQISEYCKLEDSSKELLKIAMERLNLSESEHIQGSHISEAIQYRSLDREGWLG